MKRFVCVLVALTAVVAVSQAQLKFGIKAGANVNSLSTDLNDMMDQVKNSTNYQFGVLLQAKALGFAIQPEVLYVAKSSQIKDLTVGDYNGATVEFKSQNIEVPVNLQYGFGFIIGRAYLQAGPYVSFVASTMIDGEKDFEENLKNSMSSFDYGVGAGFGVELLGFQLSARYDWGLGKLGDAQIPTSVVDAVENSPFGNMQNRTLNVSLAYLF